MRLDEDVHQKIENLQLVLVLQGKGSEFEVLVDIGSTRPQQVVNEQLHHVLKSIWIVNAKLNIDEVPYAEEFLHIDLEEAEGSDAIPIVPPHPNQWLRCYFDKFEPN